MSRRPRSHRPASAPAPQPPIATPGDSNDVALTCVTIALLALVLIQSLVGYDPNPWWGIDPRSDQSQLPHILLRPTVAAVLHWLTMLVSLAAVVLTLKRSQRTQRWRLLLSGLALAPAMLIFTPAVNWAGEGFVRCLGWSAAAYAGVAALHLCEDPRQRRIIVSALMAMIVPWLIRAGWYVLVEHPATLEHYRQNLGSLLEARGWQKGSVQHELYERRLMKTAATGAFGFSNVFGTIAGAATMVAAGGAAGAVACRRWRSATLTSVLAILGLIIIYMTGSKGAALAVVIVAAVLALAVARRVPRPVVAGAALAVVALAFGAILVRGAIGPPEDPTGERSLLFRYHYLEASWDMLREEPGAWTGGVGVSQFQGLYQKHKPQLSPEEVKSAHNMFVDWIVMLGIGGWLWCGVTMVLLARAGLGAAPDDPRDEDEAPPANRTEIHLRDVAPFAILAAMLFGGQYLLQSDVFSMGHALMWGGSAGGFVIAATLLNHPGLRLGRGAMSLGLLGGAAMLMVHSQIEMAFFHHGSMAVAWLLLGAAGANLLPRAVKPADDAGEGVVKQLVWKTAAPAMFLAITLVAALPHSLALVDQQRHLHRAADAWSQGRAAATEQHLEAAIQAAPTDVKPRIDLARMHMSLAVAAAQNGDRPAASQRLEQAMNVLANAPMLEDRPAIIRMLARAAQLGADLLRSPDHLEMATGLWRGVVEANPQGLEDHLNYADVLWQADRPEDARAIYRRCLEISDNMYLDPAKQLTPEQRALVLERLSI